MEGYTNNEFKSWDYLLPITLLASATSYAKNFGRSKFLLEEVLQFRAWIGNGGTLYGDSQEAWVMKGLKTMPEILLAVLIAELGQFINLGSYIEQIVKNNNGNVPLVGERL